MYTLGTLRQPRTFSIMSLEPDDPFFGGLVLQCIKLTAHPPESFNTFFLADGKAMLGDARRFQPSGTIGACCWGFRCVQVVKVQNLLSDEM